MMTWATLGCGGDPPEVPVPAAEVTAPSTDAPFHCFGWAHGPDHSTDCYRTAEACDTARAGTGRRKGPPCRPEGMATCTTMVASGSERCFGHVAHCEAYRAMVAGRDLETGRCVGSSGASED